MQERRVILSPKKRTARSVWTQALAVPEMLCVRGDVRRICAIVTMPMRNPKIPARSITLQKKIDLNLLAYCMIVLRSKMMMRGMKRMMLFVLFYR